MLTPLSGILSPLTATTRRISTYGAYATALLATAPDGYWQLNEAEGTAAADSSINGRDGVYSVAALAERALPGPSMGNAPLFNRTHTVTLPSLPSFANASFTVAAWVFASTTLEAIHRNIFSVYENSGAGKSLRLFGFTTSLRVDDGAQVGNFVNQVTAGLWMHLIWEYDKVADLSTVYKNNLAIGTSNTGPYIGGPTPTCAISGLSGAVGWEGNIAHVAYWLRALDSNERTMIATAV